MARVRAWGLTLWELDDVEFCRTYAQANCSYYVDGKEICPETENLHWHVLMYFFNPRRFSGIQALRDWSVAPHIEIVRNIEKYAIYCKKDGVVHENGNMPHQGKRSDITLFAESVEAGLSDIELLRTFPNSFVRYGRSIDRIRRTVTMAAPYEFKAPRCTVWVGPTGTGKTRTVYSRDPNVFVLSMPDRRGDMVWWDGYVRQKGILLDDYEGEIPYRQLLRILDGYPMQLQVKGSFVTKNWSHVYITSNLPVEDWYPARNDISHLKRRINEVIEVNEPLFSDIEQSDSE